MTLNTVKSLYDESGDAISSRFIEIRADNDGKSISGVIMKYGDTAVINGKKERFEPGSIEAHPFPIMNIDHDPRQQVAVGRQIQFDHNDQRLAFRAELPDGSYYAHRARAMLARGALRGVSLDFFAERHRVDGDTTVIEKAQMLGFALANQATPYYRQSIILRAEDGAAMGTLETRAAGMIGGRIKLGVAGIRSLARKRKLLIPTDADITFDDDVYLYSGFGQDNSLASSQAGSLQVSREGDELAFRTVSRRRLANTPLLHETREKMRKGLIKGVIPGIFPTKLESYVDDDGFTVERMDEGGICHFNLINRAGAGYSGSLNRRARRLRWQR